MDDQQKPIVTTVYHRTYELAYMKREWDGDLRHEAPRLESMNNGDESPVLPEGAKPEVITLPIQEKKVIHDPTLAKRSSSQAGLQSYFHSGNIIRY